MCFIIPMRNSLVLFIIALCLFCCACPTVPPPNPPPPPPIAMNYVERLSEHLDTQDMTPTLEQDVTRQAVNNQPVSDVLSKRYNGLIEVKDEETTCDELPQ